jgi:hypothetical protein
MIKLIKSIKVGDTVIKKGTELDFDSKGCCEINGVCLELDKIPDCAIEHEDHTPITGIEAEGELQIIPAQGIANTHIITFGDQEVGRIIAEKLAMASYPDEGYLNTDDNKITVQDNAGEPIKLKALNKDIVLIPELVQQLTEHFSATENLTQDIFNDYPNVEGVVYAHDIKVIDLSDLFELCQLIKSMHKVLPIVKFASDKTVTVQGDEIDLKINFETSTYSISGKEANPVETFIRTHFGEALKPAKPEVAKEALITNIGLNFLKGF